MKYYRLTMRIVGFQESCWKIKICNRWQSTVITYNPNAKKIWISDSGRFASFLRQRQSQLLRILNNKDARTFYPNFRLKFILSHEPIQCSFFNPHLITVIDSRTSQRNVYKKSHSGCVDCEVFTDGSFNYDNQIGAYAIFIRDKATNSELKTYQEGEKSNNALELKALIKALEQIEKKQSLLITTDSQYVIKGIAYWIQNWKRNRWRTASGNKVKNKTSWKKFDRLLKGRYVEFQWVKSHAGHPENALCDYYAKLRTEIF